MIGKVRLNKKTVDENMTGFVEKISRDSTFKAG